MTLQMECSVEKSVTIRAAERLEDCIIVAHKTFMNIVPQQSDSIVVYMHPFLLPSTILISYSTMFRVSSSSIKEISFNWTPWN